MRFHLKLWPVINEQMEQQICGAFSINVVLYTTKAHHSSTLLCSPNKKKYIWRKKGKREKEIRFDYEIDWKENNFQFLLSLWILLCRVLFHIIFSFLFGNVKNAWKALHKNGRQICIFFPFLFGLQYRKMKEISDTGELNGRWRKAHYTMRIE